MPPCSAPRKGMFHPTFSRFAPCRRVPCEHPFPAASQGGRAQAGRLQRNGRRLPVSPEEQKRGACRRLAVTGALLRQAGWHSISNAIKSQDMVYYKEHESKCTGMGGIFRVACQFRCCYFACNSGVFYCTRLVSIDNLYHPLYTDNADRYSILQKPI